MKARQILARTLGNAAFANENSLHGVWVEGPPLPYGYFINDAGEKDVLDAISAASVDPSFRLKSDTACRTITWDQARKDLMYDKGPQRHLPGWCPETVADKRCYTCLRCPYNHTILVDAKAGKIYHAISEIRE